MKTLNQTEIAGQQLKVEISASLVLSLMITLVLIVISQPVGQALIAKTLMA